MEREINLLRIKEKISAKEVRLKQFLQVGSGLLLVLYILVLGGVFSFWLIQQRESQIVGDKIKLAEGKIAGLKKIESLQVAIKGRLQTLASAFEDEELNYEDFLTQLEQLTPSGVVLADFELTKNGEITISGSADNSLSLGEFLVNLTGSKEEDFKGIAVSSISRGQDGSYDFSLELLFKTS